MSVRGYGYFHLLFTLCQLTLLHLYNLQTVYGELLPVEDNLDIMGLSRYIATRLLNNPDICDEFAHPTVPHLYRDGFSTALNQFMLKKFLLLVLFLDNAKGNRLIDHDPCLFCKDALYKVKKTYFFSRLENCTMKISWKCTFYYICPTVTLIVYR